MAFDINDPLEKLLAGCHDRLQDRVNQLNRAVDGEGTKGTMKEAAMLQAAATEEAGVLVIAAARQVADRMQSLSTTVEHRAARLTTEIAGLNKRIEIFTTKADSGSNRLIVATWALAIAAITAAVIGAYATLNVKPEIITVSPPTPPSVVLTPAPVIAPQVPARAVPR